MSLFFLHYIWFLILQDSVAAKTEEIGKISVKKEEESPVDKDSLPNYYDSVVFIKMRCRQRNQQELPAVFG